MVARSGGHLRAAQRLTAIGWWNGRAGGPQIEIAGRHVAVIDGSAGTSRPAFAPDDMPIVEFWKPDGAVLARVVAQELSKLSDLTARPQLDRRSQHGRVRERCAPGERWVGMAIWIAQAIAQPQRSCLCQRMPVEASRCYGCG